LRESHVSRNISWVETRLAKKVLEAVVGWCVSIWQLWWAEKALRGSHLVALYRLLRM
jgi:hypothetical protein